MRLHHAGEVTLVRFSWAATWAIMMAPATTPRGVLMMIDVAPAAIPVPTERNAGGVAAKAARAIKATWTPSKTIARTMLSVR